MARATATVAVLLTLSVVARAQPGHGLTPVEDPSKRARVQRGGKSSLGEPWERQCRVTEGRVR
jgi:hypothetical protein